MPTRDELRKKLLRQRKALTATQCQTAAQDLLIQFRAWFNNQSFGLEKKTSLNVAGYICLGGEIDISPIFSDLTQLGHRIYVPVVRPEQNGVLLFAEIDDSTKFVTGKYNISEPVYNVNALLGASSLDLVLVPLVGIDSGGNRLGMGGGYYDRTFSVNLENGPQVRSPVLLGVCHALQTLSSVPVEHWDVPLDAVITDQSIIK